MFYSSSTNGFYSVDIHGNLMPQDVVEITIEKYKELLQGQTDGAKISSDEAGRPVLVWPPAPTNIQLISEKKLLINVEFEKTMRQITAGVPLNEISSWSKQESEARAYLGNNGAATPLIDALAQARLVPKAELVDRIIVKADQFAAFSGQLIGKRQGLEDSLDALDENATAEDIAAIVWSAP